MTDQPAAFSITIDANDLDAMERFYTERLGFTLTHADPKGTMYERRTLRHAEADAQLVVRNCLPRPNVGTAPGSLLEITLRVPDPEAAAEGLRVDRREPEEGPADRVVVRDPSNYHVVLERT